MPVVSSPPTSPLHPGTVPSSERTAPGAGGTPSAVKQEVRFAVVMYGGVSLAIYINGIAQELLRLVRATAPGRASAEPSGTEAVYRKLGQMLSYGEEPLSLAEVNAAKTPLPVHTRFVVDVISGTSAGGINGVFLAKALANGQSIDRLKQLWIDEGAIELLLNDSQCVAGIPGLTPQKPPQSLLSGRRMYAKLLEAFRGMERNEKGETVGGEPLVDALDLFVTTTDVRGAIVPLRLADDVVFERRHRSVFHFRFAREGASADPGNDFEAARNAQLAFAARCTSSFPFAFEPTLFTDAAEISTAIPPAPGTSEARDASDFFGPGEPGARRNANPGDDHRAFGDGGYLDNKPFTYALDALSFRHATVPVDRKLLFIEPDPVDPRVAEQARLARENNGAGKSAQRPDAVENSLAALVGIPRYETIREDLQRLLARNQLVRRVRTIIDGYEDDLSLGGLGTNKAIEPPQPTYGEQKGIKATFAQKTALESTASAGPSHAPRARAQPAAASSAALQSAGYASYSSYHRLKVNAITDEIATIVTHKAGLDRDSDEFLAIVALVRAWRDLHYDHHGAEGKKPFNDFLLRFDLGYRFRRLDFVRRKADSLACVTPPRGEGRLSPAQQALKRAGVQWNAPTSPDPRYADAVAGIRQKLTDQWSLLARVRTELLRPVGEPLFGGREPRTADDRKIAEYVEAMILAIKALGVKSLSDARELRAATAAAGNGAGGSSSATLLLDLLERRADGDRELLAKQRVLDGLDGPLSDIAKAISDCIAVGTMQASEHCAALLDPSKDANVHLQEYALRPREALWSYYTRYENYDWITYPLMYATEVGEELDTIQVMRVSPLDAKRLDGSFDGKPRRKLGGATYGHFGGFLDRGWRANDILWGRLDGAERIISVLLPGDERAADREALIDEAHRAILVEEFRSSTREQVADLIVSTALRAPATGPEEMAFDSALRGHAEKAVGRNPLRDALILGASDETIHSLFREHYQVSTHLEPKAMLQVMARGTAVLGRILEGITAERERVAERAAWITRLGQWFWGLVSVAVPGSLAQLFFAHWVRLLYVFELVLIVGGTLLVNENMQQFGLLLFGVTAAVHSSTVVLGNYMSGHSTLKRITRRVTAVWVGIVLGFAALAVALVAGRTWPLGVIAWLRNAGLSVLLAGAAVAIVAVLLWDVIRRWTPWQWVWRIAAAIGVLLAIVGVFAVVRPDLVAQARDFIGAAR